MIKYIISWNEVKGQVTNVYSRCVRSKHACEALELFLKNVDAPEEIIALSIERMDKVEERSAITLNSVH